MLQGGEGGLSLCCREARVGRPCVAGWRGWVVPVLQGGEGGLSLCCREARVGCPCVAGRRGWVVPVLQGGEGGLSLCCREARMGCPCVAGRVGCKLHQSEAAKEGWLSVLQRWVVLLSECKKFFVCKCDTSLINYDARQSLVFVNHTYTYTETILSPAII